MLTAIKTQLVEGLKSDIDEIKDYLVALKRDLTDPSTLFLVYVTGLLAACGALSYFLKG